MADWNAKQYLKFEKQRTQPARDLAMRVANSYSPKKVVDIGCGPGNSTAVLKEIFPDADILGIDNSSNMIERARSKYLEIDFKLCDASQLTEQYDLIFSNACLQWIPEHESFIPALMSHLIEGGILAVQVPMNDGEPLFQLITEVVRDTKWQFAALPAQVNTTLTPSAYFNLLTSCSSAFDIWETKYYHPLENHAALVEWVKSTRIRPYLDCLGEEHGDKFVTELIERSKSLYPCMDNGEVLLGFRRFFFTAVK